MPKFKSRHHQTSKTEHKEVKLDTVKMEDLIDPKLFEFTKQYQAVCLQKFVNINPSSTNKKAKNSFFSRFFTSKKPIEPSKKINILDFLNAQPKPTSVVIFSQEEFKKEYMRINNKSETFFTRNGNPRLVAGLCGGLVYTWYESLLQGKDFLAEIKNGLSESRMNTIIDRQEILGGAPCFRNAAEAKSNSIEKSEVDLPPPVMNYFGFHKASEHLIADAYEANLQKHIEALEKSNLIQSGLHTISAFPKNGSGHICGWTACEDGYLLFDANRGEYYFDSFPALKNYLNHHLLNMFNGDQDLSVTLQDYYLPEECTHKLSTKNHFSL